MHKQLVVQPVSSLFLTQAEHIAEQLQVPLSWPLPEKLPSFYLQIGPQGLSVIERDKNPTEVRVDFIRGALGYRHRHGGDRQAIAKAVGVHKIKEPLRLLDATAGFGADGFILAALKCRVVMLERCKIVALLLSDGLNRAALHPQTQATIARMQLHHCSFQDYARSATAHAFDIVYLDPMFPQKNNSAGAKKAIQLLRKIIGPDPDQSDLLPLALSMAKKRVVVKRSKQSVFLNNICPNHQIIGKSTRFDVYLAYNHISAPQVE